MSRLCFKSSPFSLHNHSHFDSLRGNTVYADAFKMLPVFQLVAFILVAILSTLAQSVPNFANVPRLGVRFSRCSTGSPLRPLVNQRTFSAAEGMTAFGTGTLNYTITIPTVFHIVQFNETLAGGNITQKMLADQVALLKFSLATLGLTISVKNVTR